MSVSDIPLVIAAFLGWKYIKGTKLVSLADVPLREALQEVLRSPEPEEPRAVGWKKFVSRF